MLQIDDELKSFVNSLSMNSFKYNDFTLNYIGIFKDLFRDQQTNLPDDDFQLFYSSFILLYIIGKSKHEGVKSGDILIYIITQSYFVFLSDYFSKNSLNSIPKEDRDIIVYIAKRFVELIRSLSVVFCENEEFEKYIKMLHYYNTAIENVDLDLERQLNPNISKYCEQYCKIMFGFAENGFLSENHLLVTKFIVKIQTLSIFEILTGSLETIRLIDRFAINIGYQKVTNPSINVSGEISELINILSGVGSSGTFTQFRMYASKSIMSDWVEQKSEISEESMCLVKKILSNIYAKNQGADSDYQRVSEYLRELANTEELKYYSNVIPKAKDAKPHYLLLSLYRFLPGKPDDAREFISFVHQMMPKMMESLTSCSTVENLARALRKGTDTYKMLLVLLSYVILKTHYIRCFENHLFGLNYGFSIDPYDLENICSSCDTSNRSENLNELLNIFRGSLSTDANIKITSMLLDFLSKYISTPSDITLNRALVVSSCTIIILGTNSELSTFVRPFLTNTGDRLLIAQQLIDKINHYIIDCFSIEEDDSTLFSRVNWLADRCEDISDHCIFSRYSSIIRETKDITVLKKTLKRLIEFFRYGYPLHNDVIRVTYMLNSKYDVLREVDMIIGKYSLKLFDFDTDEPRQLSVYKLVLLYCWSIYISLGEYNPYTYNNSITSCSPSELAMPSCHYLVSAFVSGYYDKKLYDDMVNLYLNAYLNHIELLKENLRNINISFSPSGAFSYDWVLIFFSAVTECGLTDKSSDILKQFSRYQYQELHTHWDDDVRREIDIRHTSSALKRATERYDAQYDSGVFNSRSYDSLQFNSRDLPISNTNSPPLFNIEIPGPDQILQSTFDNSSYSVYKQSFVTGNYDDNTSFSNVYKPDSNKIDFSTADTNMVPIVNTVVEPIVFSPIVPEVAGVPPSDPPSMNIESYSVSPFNVHFFQNNQHAEFIQSESFVSLVDSIQKCANLIRQVHDGSMNLESILGYLEYYDKILGSSAYPESAIESRIKGHFAYAVSYIRNREVGNAYLYALEIVKCLNDYYWTNRQFSNFTRYV